MRRHHLLIKLLDLLLDFLVKGEQKMKPRKSCLNDVISKMNTAAKEVADGQVPRKYEEPIEEIPNEEPVINIACMQVKEGYEEFYGPNKMHIDEISSYAKSLSEDEAVAIAKVMVKKYPDVIFTALMDEFESMKHTLNTITDAFK